MNKLTALISQIFGGKSSGLTTTQMRMGVETSQIKGLRFIKNIPFFGSKPFKDQYKILMYLLIPVSIATVGVVVYGAIETNETAQRIEKSTQLQMLSQRTARLAAQLSNGESKAAPVLTEAVEAVIRNIKDLKEGNADSGLGETTGDPVEKLNAFMEKWKADEARAQMLIKNADNLLEMKRQVDFVYDTSTSAIEILHKLRVLQLEKETSTADAALTDSLASALIETQQIAASLSTAVLIPIETTGIITAAAKSSATTIDTMLNGSTEYGVDAVTNADYKDRLQSLKMMGSSINADVKDFIKLIDTARDVKVAAFELGRGADKNLQTLRELTESYTQQQDVGRNMNITAFLLALLSMSIGFFWIWLKLQETRLTTAQVEESIMQLMTDLIAISDGNLSIRARVAENMTGAIADSLNLTVTRLNQTMAGVKDSSQTVRRGAEQMTSDAAVILEAVRDQSSKIKDASASVNSIADSVQAIAFAAEQSSDVARQQSSATEQGREAVTAAISAMDSIRDQIQDTAKRIKRLGESAQEIDEIIELISDTTEQTNVLAMNASIQAAAAGEAGRGFRAVATEVQRLAERSDQSLKRIVALIRSMQADTQNAVSAMERSTQEVVAGAQTTNRAGEALNLIETVSSELNSLISAITEATQQQTTEAKNITERMGEILSISDNTARGVEHTTTGIQTISELAEDLDDTMGQFKLQ